MNSHCIHRWLSPNLLLIVSLTVFAGATKAQWVTRDVTEVHGVFNDVQPQFGFEVGEGTSHVEWGDPLDGEFASFLEFNGYDALPGFSQEWFYGGQVVMPGQSFRLGEITFRNGDVAASSSATILNIDLDTHLFGAEFQTDNHPLIVDATWQVRVVQTPNIGVDAIADADFIYFPMFPWLGSVRIREGKTATVPVFAKFGSLIPTAFGAVTDPSAGVVIPSIVENLGFQVWTEVGDAGPSVDTAQITQGSGPLSTIIGSLSGLPEIGSEFPAVDTYLIRIDELTTTNFLFSAGFGPLYSDPLPPSNSLEVALFDLSSNPIIDYSSSSPIEEVGILPGIYALSIRDLSGYVGGYRIDFPSSDFFVFQTVSFSEILPQVPEPSALEAVAMGFIALVGSRRRRQIRIVVREKGSEGQLSNCADPFPS